MRKRIVVFIAIVMAAALGACAKQSPMESSVKSSDESSNKSANKSANESINESANESINESVGQKEYTEEEAWKIITDAYVYAFPLMMTDATKCSATNVEEADLAGHAPVNQFIHAQHLANADAKMVVTPNVDTIYTQAWMDISEEPMIYMMPKTDRFFKVQIMDAWTNTVAVLDAPGEYAFVSPDWNGVLPKIMTRIEVPTNTVWMIARILSKGEDDLPAVKEIQNEMELVPLSVYNSDAYQNGDGDKTYDMPKGKYDKEHDFVPVEHVISMDLQTYFETANRLMEENPPAEEDKDVLEKFAALAIGPGLTFDSGKIPGDETAHFQQLKNNLKTVFAGEIQKYGVKLGDWKYFGPPIGDFGTAYTYRAVIALNGLGANTTDVAIYPKTDTDKDGQVLNGEKTYTLHLDSLPPIKEGGFWSITAYGSDNFLIANKLNRYCINDRSDCVFNKDGSLDIILSVDEPKENTANWLPVSKEEFHLFMRIYSPDEEAIKTWQAPIITAVETAASEK